MDNFFKIVHAQKNRAIFFICGKIILIIFIVIFFASISFFTLYEQKDSFCASCHMQPEKRYYLQSIAKEKKTLAAKHAQNGTRCIDCHSGKWISGRIWAQIGGLRNAFVYFSGSYNKVNSTTRPVGAGGCTKCHNELFWSLERPGHYHSPWILDDWHMVTKRINICENCHFAHKKYISKIKLKNNKRIKKQCKSCHQI